MIDTSNLPRGVCIVPMRAGTFAVSQRLDKLRHPRLWQFPGGHVEPGEDTLAAACRELYEETGLLLPLGRFELIGVAGPLVGYTGNQYMGYRYGVTLTDTEELAQSEPDKHTPWEWVPCDKILELEMLQSTKEFALAFALRKYSRWKAEMMAVESQWNIQAVGKLLDVPLGKDIRPYIEPGIRQLIADKAALIQDVNNREKSIAHLSRSAEENAGPCPECKSVDTERQHFHQRGSFPECFYKHCNACGHQWDQT